MESFAKEFSSLKKMSNKLYIKTQDLFSEYRDDI